MADVGDFLLFNDSPQIVGNDITVDFTIEGCAQLTCEVLQRTAQVDCNYLQVDIEAIHCLLC